MLQADLFMKDVRFMSFKCVNPIIKSWQKSKKFIYLATKAVNNNNGNWITVKVLLVLQIFVNGEQYVKSMFNTQRHELTIFDAAPLNFPDCCINLMTS